MTPLKRFFNLLRLDKKDVLQIFFYAIFAGLISLSLPIGIQAIIVFIQAGRISASWVLLIFLVVFGVALVGLLSLMQLRITENLQQKIFVRSSFDFTARFPKIKFESTYNIYPAELANRFFDTLSIQKGTSKLLIDFSAALLQIFFGIILLSIYHPYFILFGLALLILLYLIFKNSYTTGLNTSLKESHYKYKVAGWIQEIARNHFSFRNTLNYHFALQKNDTLLTDYLSYREKHFKVLQKQFSQLIVFKMIISAGLLSVGGFLVLNQQMNVGQFVAAEIIILLVIGSVEKIILGLETFYDVLTSVEKIGWITDLELEAAQDFKQDYCYTKIQLETENLRFRFPESKNDVLKSISLKIEQGETIFLEGENGSGKTTLIRILAGLLQPTSGVFFINDDMYRKMDLEQYRSQIGTIFHGETPFEGTIKENITFNDATVSDEDLKWAIDAVQLGSYIKSLPEGLDTKIFPEGKKLSSSNARKILLARSIIHKPKILFYENPTDTLDEIVASEIIDFILSDKHSWTVIVTSKNERWKAACSRIIALQNGKITSDLKQ
ncbi:ATP-binding cassette domain-containing protein [Flavobacterium sp. CYK-4]|uniref:peptidase domain-containing ABC transporter n=1 Tax=Flavobacterium lotistagni TaxID=2709660 RepID=UPI00140BDAA4|nr:ATP-binding cassette domain-containing protein [Flavobacterium lotistagni]NHM08135.1 ATP-binding cassette domain-containing protein [Flavobacterium lotistagni]